MNALNATMCREIAEHLSAIRDDRSIRVLILTGAGDRAFCGGADVKEMAALGALDAVVYLDSVNAAIDGLESLPKPVVAAVNGFALGGGCELCLAADIRICSSTSTFGQPEVKIGVLPGAGATQRLPHVVGTGMAKEMIFTGRMVKADEALRVGLVNAVHAPDALMAEALRLAGMIAANAPLAVAASKSAINHGVRPSLSFGRDYDRGLWGVLFATADQKEGMSAFIEKRQPQFSNH
jgi:enoyl-CoA hydratase